jgi:hypothetical protein
MSEIMHVWGTCRDRTTEKEVQREETTGGFARSRVLGTHKFSAFMRRSGGVRATPGYEPPGYEQNEHHATTVTAFSKNTEISTAQKKQNAEEVTLP